MTSLQAIGFTLAGGTCVSLISVCAFGFAVRNRHYAIAPRCTARPKDTIYNPNTNKDKSQNVGNPWFGWIPWTLGLSYDTMLRGVPGTGTRKNGLKGALLNVNLDAIILFRFNALCMRVSVLTTLLVIVIILPLNWTARPEYNEVSFNRTTLANIPSLGSNTKVTSADVLIPSTFFEKLILNLKSEPGTQLRLYIIVLCSWIVTYYLCIEIGKEWKDNLALRRKHYFEADHHKKRKNELRHTLLKSEDVDFRKRRDPWIPHPEQRDTVPNVELYSVLVGDLPSLPTEVVDEKDLEATIGFTEQQKIDWQLAVATTFFDHCVPNQPGFSSSVAAVTILPEAAELAAAWRKWYTAASALRRLRFIRSVIADRRYFDLDEVSDHAPNIDEVSQRNLFVDDDYSMTGEGDGTCTQQSVDVNSMAVQQRVQYFREFYCNEEVETQFMQALNIGPEQTAVYTREFAQGAANCCPNGCNEGRVRHSRIDELLEMEREAVNKVQDANKVLRNAQAKAGNVDDSTNTADNVVNHVTTTAKHDLLFDEHYDNQSQHVQQNVQQQQNVGMVSSPSSVSIEITNPNHSQESHDHIELQHINTTATTPPTTTATPTNISMDSNSTPRMSHSKNKKKPILNDKGIDLPTLMTPPSTLHNQQQLPPIPPNTSSITNNNNRSTQSSNTPSTISDITSHRRSVNELKLKKGLSKSLKMEVDFLEKYSNSPVLHEFKSNHIVQSKHKHNSSPSLNNMNSRHEHSSSSDGLNHLVSNANASNTTTATNHLVSNANASNTTTATTTNNNDLLANSYSNHSLDTHFTTNTHPIKNISTNNNKDGSDVVTLSSHDNNLLVSDRRISFSNDINNKNKTLSNNELQRNKLLSPLSSIQQQQQTSSSPIPYTVNTTTTPNSITTTNNPYSHRFLQNQASANSMNFNAEGQIVLNSNTLNNNIEDESIHHQHRSSNTTTDSFSSSIHQYDYNPDDFFNNSSNNNCDNNMFSNNHLTHRRKTNNGNNDNNDNEQQNESSHATTPPSTNTNNNQNNSITTTTTAAGEGGFGYYHHNRKDGVWSFHKSETLLSFQQIAKYLKHTMKKIFCKRVVHVANGLHRSSTIAIVTFTSRQAAVAARHCLADGRGANRWVALDNIPVPPLADAAPFDLITCRGCCRPVTLSIPKQQQVLRKWCSTTLLIVICVFYTIPITLISNLFNVSELETLMPNFYERVSQSVFGAKILSGFIPAILQSLFFSVCPMIFKAIANFGSNATSVSEAEFYAMKYYWWFMVSIAFTGNTLATSSLNALSQGLKSTNIPSILESIANTVPVQLSSIWINWIILRFTIILPVQYLLQFNTFLFLALGWRCCARCVMGGGVGGPLPYRIYIDGGTVFMCLISLSFASPLVAPFCFVYFLVCEPVWRRNSIFLYRPKYDGGGFRWPFLSDICFSCAFLSQVLLTTMLGLKNSVGPACLAGAAIIPTYMFRKLTKTKYLRAYEDAGLLQTSLLDMWDTSHTASPKKREEFRRFLVDTHKAAYIPVCISGTANNILTTEPAVVVPLESDLLSGNLNITANKDPTNMNNTTNSGRYSSGGTPGFETPKANADDDSLCNSTSKYPPMFRSPATYLDSDVSVVQYGMSFRRSNRQLSSITENGNNSGAIMINPTESDDRQSV